MPNETYHVNDGETIVGPSLGNRLIVGMFSSHLEVEAVAMPNRRLFLIPAQFAGAARVEA